MLDLNLIREQPDLVRVSMQDRQMDPAVVDSILDLDERRRQLLTQVEKLKAERNATSKEIGRLAEGHEREAKIAAMRRVGDEIAALDQQVTRSVWPKRLSTWQRYGVPTKPVVR